MRAQYFLSLPDPPCKMASQVMDVGTAKKKLSEMLPGDSMKMYVCYFYLGLYDVAWNDINK